MEFTLFHFTTGRIVGNGSCSYEAVQSYIDWYGEGYVYIEGIYDTNTMYMRRRKPTPRPIFPGSINKTEIVANGIDTVTITLTTDVTYHIRFSNSDQELTTYNVSDGSFEFTVDTAGEYKLEIEGFPYLKQEYTINAS